MNWLIKRTILAIVTAYISISITFVIVRLMPGNPVDILIQRYLMLGYSYEEAATLVSAIIPLLPSKPIHEQYIDYLLNVLRGNLGRSLVLGTSVNVFLSYAIPWTVFIVGSALLISFTIGVILGMFMAYKRGSLFDRILSFFASVTGALPSYAIGVILALVLGIQLKWFPVLGAYSAKVEPGFNLPFIIDVLYHAFLPVFTYVLVTVGGWMLTMKSSTVSVLGEYFVIAAEARGLPERRIVLTYVGRNAILPLIARLTISTGYMFGGAVFIETIFSYPGVGRYLVDSISTRDYPLMTGIFLVITFAVIFANLIADIIYSIIDPRIRASRMEGE